MMTFMNKKWTGAFILGMTFVFGAVTGCESVDEERETQGSEEGDVEARAVSNKVCQSSADCPFGSYCEKDPGNCDDSGTCQTKTLACSSPWSPVCGCNQKTYLNKCLANWAGVSVAHAGKCGGSCGQLKQPKAWPASGYYLELSSNKDMFFHIWVTSANGIAHIEKWLASNPTNENLGIPGAPIELVSTTNPGYSYRMVPSEVRFGQMWIEACDGNPCYIEDNARAWNNKLWCPWNARPVRVWRCDGKTENSCGDPVF